MKGPNNKKTTTDRKPSNTKKKSSLAFLTKLLVKTRLASVLFPSRHQPENPIFHPVETNSPLDLELPRVFLKGKKQVYRKVAQQGGPQKNTAHVQKKTRRNVTYTEAMRPHTNSDQQDCYMFSSGFLWTFILPLLGGHPKLIYLLKRAYPNPKGKCSKRTPRFP